MLRTEIPEAPADLNCRLSTVDPWGGGETNDTQRTAVNNLHLTLLIWTGVTFDRLQFTKDTFEEQQLSNGTSRTFRNNSSGMTLFRNNSDLNSAFLICDSSTVATQLWFLNCSLTVSSFISRAVVLSEVLFRKVSLLNCMLFLKSFIAELYT